MGNFKGTMLMIVGMLVLGIGVGVTVVMLKGTFANVTESDDSKGSYVISDSIIEDADYEYVLSYYDYKHQHKFMYFDVNEVLSSVGFNYRGNVSTYLEISNDDNVSIAGGACHINIDGTTAVVTDFALEHIKTK